ncbi:MAG: hypothetical protein IPL46_23905 [Saprospiraceae bacterium]|nr:hypothetical protein [Saprospiraceae bacterium]
MNLRINNIVPIFEHAIAKYWPSSGQYLNQGSRCKTIYFATLVCLLVSCNISHEEEASILHTIDQLDSLNLEMDGLKSANDNMWNQVSQSIEKALPADLPAAEKRNLLAVKNADLIQMFQVYDSLGDPIKNQVMEAGKSDQQTAGKMREIMSRVDELNKTLTQNFASLEKKDRLATERLKAKIDTEKNEAVREK